MKSVGSIILATLGTTMVSDSLNSVFNRLARGVGANFFGKVWVLILQIISVPIITKCWGVDGFGVWIMISTIPTYLALSDFGLATAAGVDITISVRRNEMAAALQSFQSAWFFLTLISISIVCLVITISLIWFSYSDRNSDISVFSEFETGLAISMITVSAFITMQMNIRKIVFQATYQYAFGTALFDGIFFIGNLLVLVAIMMGASLAEAAATQVCSRLIGLIVFTVVQRSRISWAIVGFQHVSMEYIKRLMSPSFAALSLTFANSFGLQGVVLSIGWIFGPTAAAIFATTRMLTRIPMQISGLLTRASLPELIYSQSADNKQLTNRLTNMNVILTLGAMIPCVIVLGFWGPYVINFISHGEIQQNNISFVILGMSAAFCAIWTALGTRLVAQNRQSEFAYLALALYLICTVIPLIFRDHMQPILIFILLSDILIAFQAWKRIKDD